MANKFVLAYYYRMHTLILLFLITVCYAAYNLLVKISGSHIGATTSPILATICLQATALVVSIVYLIYITGQTTAIALPARACLWAVAAGLCIGLAEISYFYLFRGIGDDKPMAASSAIPFIVGGTIVIAVMVSRFVFNESLNTGQWIGAGLAFTGMMVLAMSAG